MKTRNNQTMYQTFGSAALKPVSLGAKPHVLGLHVLEGGVKAPRRVSRLHATTKNHAVSQQQCLLTQTQILGTYVCFFATTALVLAMWAFMR